MPAELPEPIAQLVRASVTGDMSEFLGAWLPDALLSDSHRKYWGQEAIRRWCSIEWLGDNVGVTEVRDVITRGDDLVLYAVLDGIYDKEGLPSDYLGTFMIKIRDNKIARMVIVPCDGRRLGKMTQTRMASTCFSAPMPTLELSDGTTGRVGRWMSSGTETAATLPAGVTQILNAIRARDFEQCLAAFTDDALVNDKHRQLIDPDAISRWVKAELIENSLDVEILGHTEHYGDSIITAALNGGFDRSLFDQFTANSSMTTLHARPPAAVHALYFTPDGNKVKQLIVTPIDGSSPIKTDQQPLYVAYP